MTIFHKDIIIRDIYPVTGNRLPIAIGTATGYRIFTFNMLYYLCIHYLFYQPVLTCSAGRLIEDH